MILGLDISTSIPGYTLIDKNGRPDVLIDHFSDSSNKGLAIWGISDFLACSICSMTGRTDLVFLLASKDIR